MQQKYQKLYSFSDLIDVHGSVDQVIDIIFHSCEYQVKDRRLTRAVPHYTHFSTLLLLDNIVEHYLSQPIQLTISQDIEPLPPQKDTFTNQIVMNILKKKDLPIERDHSLIMRKSTNRMKTSSVVMISKRTRMSFEKEEFEIIKLETPPYEMDEQEKYYRLQHEQQQELLERIAKNQKQLEDQKLVQKKQIESIHRKKETYQIGYDFDGTILPYNKPQLKTKQYQLHAKLVQRKQNKSQKNSKNSIDSVLITNAAKMENLHTHTFQDQTQPRFGLTANSLKPNINPVIDHGNKEQQLDMLRHDTTLRMTKKQYNETSAVFCRNIQVEMQAKINQPHYCEENVQTNFRDTLEQIVAPKLGRQKDGKIKVLSHIRNILTEQSEQRELELNLQENQSKNRELSVKQKQKQFVEPIGFSNVNGKLPPLKSQQIKPTFNCQNTLIGRSKRSVTQYC